MRINFSFLFFFKGWEWIIDRVRTEMRYRIPAMGIEITMEIRLIDAPSKVPTMTAAITAIALLQSNFMIKVLANQAANAEARSREIPWQTTPIPIDVETLPSSRTPLRTTICATNNTKPVIANRINVARAEMMAGVFFDMLPPARIISACKGAGTHP